MVQKHPKRTAVIALVATAGVGTIYYCGPKTVAVTLMSAGAKVTPVIKAVTFKKVKQAVVTTAAVALTAAVIQNAQQNAQQNQGAQA